MLDKEHQQLLYSSERNKGRRTKNLILAARVFSMLFTPFYLPLVGLVALFLFSYLSLLPLSYKCFVLALVCVFTILIPTLLIRVYRHYQGWTLIELGHKERRMVPYVISIMCYLTCVYMMGRLHIPHFMGNIITAALMVQIVCAIINAWWKISTHTAAIGGVAGALFAFAEIFGFNPIWWMCIVFLLAGLLGTSRMVLRQHSLSQVTGGFCIGMVCSALTILFV